MDKTRREVLIPGSLLPSEHRGEGRFHGIVTCVKRSNAALEAFISISDLRNVRIKLPWEEAQQYCLDAPSGSDWKSQKRARSKRKPGDWHNLQLPFTPAAPAASSMKEGTKFCSLNRPHTRAAAQPKAEQPPTKRPRGRPRKAGTAVLPPTAVPVPRRGAALLQRISEISEDTCTRWVVGTQLLAKVRGWKCHWPVVVWSARLCLRKDMGQLLESHKHERVLVRFYGERSMMWVRQEDLRKDSLDDGHVADMQDWERLHRKPGLVQSVLEELEGACGEPAAEVARLQRLQQIHSFSTSASCTLCLEPGAELHCGQCQRAMHTLCLQQPCLTPTDLPDGAWDCPCCGQANTCLGDEAEVDTEEKVERMGLTPDWIIQAASFVVFRLPRPTPEQPFIAGLLDPCTNSMVAPNIPAQVLYDKKMNGLLMSNSWAGFHVLLNPDYSAATQWRFVNRAIDEVENDRVPAVLLVCRNSTDTAYFQRLRPYPRVMLRRGNARFKDYDKTPIGFGVAVFCIAKAPATELYERFFDGFAAMGEPNIPIDKALMQSTAFLELLGRLKRHSEEHQRDHWIQCSLCVQWRIIAYETLLQVRSDASWTCAQLRPPFSSCRTPCSKRELAGTRGYATIGSSESATPGQPSDGPCAGTAAHEDQPAEDACTAVEAPGSLEACASTSMDAAGGASSESSCAAAAAAADPPQCPLRACTDSSCSEGAVQLETDAAPGDAPGACNSDPENAAHTLAVPTCAACRGEESLQQDSQESDTCHLQSCQVRAPVQQMQPAQAHAPQQQEAPVQLAQQHAVIAFTTCGVATRAATPCMEPAGSPAAEGGSLVCKPPATAISGDDSAGGSKGCESVALCAAAPAWAWATQHPAAPGVAVDFPPVGQPGTSNVSALGSRQAAGPQNEFLQAALQRLPPSQILSTGGLESAGDEECQQLSAIELARNARIAANRAFMASVSASFTTTGSDKSNIDGGSLPVDHPLVLAAARQLARTAALEQARQQVEAAERQWHTGQRVRNMKAAELRSQLAALEEQGLRAEELLQASRLTYKQLREEYRHETVC